MDCRGRIGSGAALRLCRPNQLCRLGVSCVEPGLGRQNLKRSAHAQREALLVQQLHCPQTLTRPSRFCAWVAETPPASAAIYE